MSLVQRATPEELALRDADKAYKRRVGDAEAVLRAAEEGEVLDRYRQMTLYADRIKFNDQEIALSPDIRTDVQTQGSLTKSKDGKTVDTRELYLVVENGEAGFTASCGPNDGERVRQLAQKIRLSRTGAADAAARRAKATADATEGLREARADRKAIEAAEGNLPQDRVAKVRRATRFGWVKWVVGGLVGLFILGVIVGDPDTKPAKSNGGKVEPAPAAPAAQQASRPSVDVTYDGAAVVRRADLTLRGSVSPAGTEVSVDGKRASVKDTRWTKTVTLEHGENRFDVDARKVGSGPAALTAVVTRNLSAAEKAARRARTKGRFIANASTISYKQLKKDPDRYEGRRVKYTGQILQIQEDGDFGGFMLLSVTHEFDDFWTDNIWVNYSRSIRSAEDDVLTIYGVVKGAKSYDTQIGGETYVPEVDARYIVE
jgi:hypothetical protein